MIQGIYRHYKGGRYYLFTIAENHETRNKDVVYLSLKYGTYNVRPLERDSRNEDSWTDLIKWKDGIERQRFVLEYLYSEEQLAKMLGSM